MKNKILYICGIIMSVFISISITILLVQKRFNKLELDSEKIITEVNITEENTIKSSVEKIYDAVILVKTYNGSRQLGSGTGFVYKVDDTSGYILTNHHVIENFTNVMITNNAGETVEAQVLGSDEYGDIAVLKIPKDKVMKVAGLGTSANLEIGDSLFTVGSPLGEKYMGTVTKGILSGKNRTVSVKLSSGNYRMDVLQTDAAINPGNSGGPLVNSNGEVVGIISLKLVEDEIEGMGFAIPIEMAMSATDMLEKGEAMIRPMLGAELIDVTSSYSLYLYRIHLDSSITSGAVVVGVEDDYPAKKAGLQFGDVIVAVDDIDIEDSSHLKYILYKYDINDVIKVTIMRDNKKMNFNLKLDKSM